MNKFLESLLIALKSLKRNKIRSFLTMLGVIIGVTSVILLVSIGQGLQNYIINQFEEMGTNLLFVMPGKFQFRDSREGGPPGGGSEKLTLDDINYLEARTRRVKSFLPIVSKTADVSYGRETYNTFVVGTTQDYEHLRKSPVTSGKFFNKSQVIGGRRVAVLGTTVVEEIFGTIEPIDKKIRVDGTTYTVVGVLSEKGAAAGSDQDDQIIIPIDAFDKQFEPGGISYAYAEVEDTSDITSAQEEMTEILGRIKNDDDFSVVDQRELLSTITSILGVLTLGLGGIAAISLLVGGIGIMNIMLVSVTERTREIGLRKAVGATPKVIRTQFLIEAVILSVGGGLIGVILGSLGTLGISQFFPASVTLWSILLAFGVSALVGVIFGIAPAIKASRLSPIEALRYE
ncbi:ABC transporter permease [Candidatus Gottesmanbacteria bacterium]|nr:ABC transporter permease [Candidatus Gottesmanbacteria bacterium]